MKNRAFLKLSGAIFGLISILHLFRAVIGWQAQIGSWQIPLWLSWVSLLVAGYLSYTAFRLSNKK